MAEDISRLLQNGSETIVRTWTEKVTADRRVQSDSRLSYIQLVDHVPQIVDELRRALANGTHQTKKLEEGKQHGRQRWQQGYELKEVVRELTLLRATLLEFIDTYRGALVSQTPETLSDSFRRVSHFMDEELYRTIEAYIEAPHHQHEN